MEQLAKSSERPTESPVTKLDTSHLLVNGQDEEFANLADLELTLKRGEESIVFPCHSSLLASASKVLCHMFVSTEKDGWEKGVNAMFAGHGVKSVRLVLAMMHGKPGVEHMMHKLDMPSIEWVEIEDLLVLANKLDAKWIAEVRH